MSTDRPRSRPSRRMPCRSPDRFHRRAAVQSRDRRNNWFPETYVQGRAGRWPDTLLDRYQTARPWWQSLSLDCSGALGPKPSAHLGGPVGDAHAVRAEQGQRDPFQSESHTRAVRGFSVLQLNSEDRSEMVLMEIER